MSFSVAPWVTPRISNGSNGRTCDERARGQKGAGDNVTLAGAALQHDAPPQPTCAHAPPGAPRQSIRQEAARCLRVEAGRRQCHLVPDKPVRRLGTRTAGEPALGGTRLELATAGVRLASRAALVRHTQHSRAPSLVDRPSGVRRTAWPELQRTGLHSNRRRYTCRVRGAVVRLRDRGC